MPGNYSYETIGSTRVIASTTGHEKVRMSVLVTATASGLKLPLICLIKRKDPIPGLKVPNNCIVVYCEQDTFTADIENPTASHVVLYLLGRPSVLDRSVRNAQGLLNLLGVKFICVVASPG